MSYLPAIDVSQYQGDINWGSISEPIVIIKMSGGDAGLYFDSKASANYYGAKNAGKHVGGYHFAGGGDPVAEADFFLKAMTPLVQNDVAVLDWEIQHADPVGWCNSFVNRWHDRTGYWPLLYINASTANSFDWSPVLKNCGLWIADYAVSPDADVPIHYTYVMHQYADAPWCDHDAWFGTINEFDAYGFQPPTPEPQPTPNPVPPTPPTPEPQPAPQPSPQPAPQPTPSPSPTPPPKPPTPPTPVPVPTPPTGQGSFWDKLIRFLKRLFHV